MVGCSQRSAVLLAVIALSLVLRVSGQTTNAINVPPPQDNPSPPPSTQGGTGPPNQGSTPYQGTVVQTTTRGTTQQPQTNPPPTSNETVSTQINTNNPQTTFVPQDIIEDPGAEIDGDDFELENTTTSGEQENLDPSLNGMTNEEGEEIVGDDVDDDDGEGNIESEVPESESEANVIQSQEPEEGELSGVEIDGDDLTGNETIPNDSQSIETETNVNQSNATGTEEPQGSEISGVEIDGNDLNGNETMTTELSYDGDTVGELTNATIPQTQISNTTEATGVELVGEEEVLSDNQGSNATETEGTPPQPLPVSTSSGTLPSTQAMQNSTGQQTPNTTSSQTTVNATSSQTTQSAGDDSTTSSSATTSPNAATATLNAVTATSNASTTSSTSSNAANTITSTSNLGTSSNTLTTSSNTATTSPNATTSSLVLGTPPNMTEEIEAEEYLADMLIQAAMEEEEEAMMTSENGTYYNATMSQASEYGISTDYMMTVVLASALSVGMFIFIIVFIMVGKRVFEGWRRRHYSRIDYLVNGMYN